LVGVSHAPRSYIMSFEMPQQSEFGTEEGREKSARDMAREFVEGTIPPDAFLRALHGREQSVGEDDVFSANADALADPAVRERVEAEGSTDVRDRYYHNLSLYHFNTAQKQAFAGAVPGAELSKALEAIHKAEDTDDAREWRRYVEATIAYCNGDRNALADSADQMEGSRREEVVSLLSGLTEYGNSDYARDFPTA